MVLVFIQFQELCLVSGLKTQLAQCLAAKAAVEIPLHFCFNRRGLGFRSAIALKLAQQNQISPQILADQCLQNLQLLPVLPREQPWLFQAIATEQGWLEFFLDESDLGRWLDFLVTTLNDASGLTVRELPAPPFAFQYLHARCQSLMTLAIATYPQHVAQWHFEDTALHPWEQHLLEAIARFGLAVAEGQFQHRLLVQVELAFWEFHRHCPLFYFLRAEPHLGAHYLQWIVLLEKLFSVCLSRIYQGAAIARL